jgi:GT2 family glycosyltransferase
MSPDNTSMNVSEAAGVNGEQIGSKTISRADPIVHVDHRDAENCFALLLGQKLPAASIQRAIGAEMRAFLQELLSSSIFLTLVLPPLMLREELPHALLDDSPSLLFIDWMQNRLPLKRETRLAIAGAKTWTQLLELLLSDPQIVSISSELIAADTERIFRERLEHEMLFRLRRSVVGAVDSSSAFEVSGWAVDVCDKSTAVTLEFYAEDAFIGSAVCIQPRPDVADVIGGNGNCGFAFKVSTAHRRSFAGGKTLTVLDSISKVVVGETFVVSSDAAQGTDVLAETRRELAELRKVIERIEKRLPDLSQRASIPIEAFDEYWERFYRPSTKMLADQRIQSRSFAYRPLISIVVPTWNSNTKLLHLAIESVRKQSYDHWEMIVSDDASNRDELRSFMCRYSSDERIRYIEGPSRSGIAANTNRALEMANGEYVASLDHDDELAPDALFCVVTHLQRRKWKLLYSDEDRIERDEFGQCVHHTPYFKPDFDPDLLLSLNYICHLVVIQTNLLRELGGFRPGFEGAQDHDLLLRVTETISEEDIVHIARILYHWRVTPGSVSRTSQLTDSIQRSIVAAVNEHLRRRQCSSKAEPHSDPLGSSRAFATRVRWSLSPEPPSASIIIATRNHLELLQPCMESVLHSTDQYPGKIDIVIVDNESDDLLTLKYLSQLSELPQIRKIRFQGPFNYSSINNAGARHANGQVLIFLNNDTIVLTKDWCTELVSNAVRPDVGAVGARLLYADGTIQHAGVITGIQGVAGHECVGEVPQSGGYFGRTQLQRSVTAVTGACLATRKQVFNDVGSFDELDLKVAFNDVDYCMKLRKAGYRVVYNPFAVLYHLESRSRGREITPLQQERHRQEALAFRSRWSEGEINDPYYNPHFERFARPFDRLRPPPEIYETDGYE